MGKLDGKTVIVTGASRGIGAEIARVFAAEGGRVACIARTLKEGEHQLEGSLETTVADITKAGGEAMPVACDISKDEECQRAVEEVRAKYGPIDVMVNNAALTYFIPIKDYPVNKWHRSIAVNFHAPFYFSRLVLEDMIPRKSGAIVNISSGAAIGPGRGPYPADARQGGTLYGAEKAALERFTQGLAQEVYADGISVTCVSPSQVVPTPGTVFHHLVDSMDDPKGEPVHLMAQAALLLASEPLEKVSGRVTYSQQILDEFGWLPAGTAKGTGLPGQRRGSGYSEI
jgi:citronellol/citronellal dehydrogenase